MHKWNSPNEWLREKLDTCNVHDLRYYLQELILVTDPDKLHDLFEKDMDADGYFDKEKV